MGREKEGKGGSRNKSQSVASEGGGRGRTWEGGRKEGDCDYNNAMASSVALPNTHQYLLYKAIWNGDGIYLFHFPVTRTHPHTYILFTCTC